MYEEYWYEFLRVWGDYSIFPREYSTKRILMDSSTFFDNLRRDYLRKNCYTSVYTYEQIESNIYDTIFIEAEDVDSVSDSIYIRDAIRKIFDKNNIKYRSYYSGGRGWHFYIDIVPTYIPDFGESIRYLVYDYLDMDGLVDKHVIGNKRGVARIPFTINEKTGRYSQVVDRPIDAKELLELTKTINIERKPLVEPRLTLLPPEALFGYKERRPVVSSRIKLKGLLVPCVAKVFKRLYKERHATHDERILLATYLMNNGYSMYEVANFFKYASDFDLEITLRHLKSLEGYKPFRCSRIQKMGLCDYNKCKVIRTMIVTNFEEVLEKYGISEEEFNNFWKANYYGLDDKAIVLSLYISDKNLDNRTRAKSYTLVELDEAVREFTEKYNKELSQGKEPRVYLNGMIEVTFVEKSNRTITYQGCPKCFKKAIDDNGHLRCPIHGLPAVEISFFSWGIKDDTASTILRIDNRFKVEKGHKYIVDLSFSAKTNRIYINDIIDVATGKSVKHEFNTGLGITPINTSTTSDDKPLSNLRQVENKPLDEFLEEIYKILGSFSDIDLSLMERVIRNHPQYTQASKEVIDSIIEAYRQKYNLVKKDGFIGPGKED